MTQDVGVVVQMAQDVNLLYALKGVLNIYEHTFCRD